MEKTKTKKEKRKKKKIKTLQSFLKLKQQTGRKKALRTNSINQKERKKTKERERKERERKERKTKKFHSSSHTHFDIKALPLNPTLLSSRTFSLGNGIKIFLKRNQRKQKRKIQKKKKKTPTTKTKKITSQNSGETFEKKS